MTGELYLGLDRAGRSLNHDEYDALLAAYTAYLYRSGLTEAIGHADEGFMHVPPKETVVQLVSSCAADIMYQR